MFRVTPNARAPLAFWATPNARLPPPLAIFPALTISWNDLRLRCLDRQRSTLLYRDEKRSFHDMLRATPNARAPLAFWATPNARLPPFNLSRP